MSDSMDNFFAAQLERMSQIIANRTPEQEAAILEEQKRREREDKRKRFAAMLEETQLPYRHYCNALSLSPESAPWYNHYKTLKTKRRGSIYILCGGRGRGKTQCAVSFARLAVKLRRSVYYTEAETIAAMRLKKDDENFYEVRNPSLLIIDALEEMRHTDAMWSLRTIERIVDWRYQDVKMTILITNHDKSKLSEAIGNSILSRVTECGDALEFTGWDSFRQQTKHDQTITHK